MIATFVGVVPVLLAISTLRDDSQEVAISLNQSLDELIALYIRQQQVLGVINTVPGGIVRPSLERGDMVGRQGDVVEDMVSDLLRFVPVFYLFASLIALRVVHFSVGYMYTLAVKDACRVHVAKVAVKAVDVELGPDS